MKHINRTNVYITISAILLSCLGTISIGFSTWIISQKDEASASGNIQADIVDSNIAGLTVVTNRNLIYGRYFYQNPANQNKYDSEFGSIIYSLKYDGSNSSITLDASLSFGTGLELFKPEYLTEIKYNNDGITYSYSDNHDAVTFNIEAVATSRDLVFTFSNKMIIDYGNELNSNSFYLRLESD